MNEIIKLKDINILDIGNTIQITGAIWSGNGNDYLCYFPNELDNEMCEMKIVDMDTEDWKKFIKQTDILETEILSNSRDGKLSKIIVRKTARQIDSRIQWKVFKRDEYKCRYCGNDDIPLSVDHIVLWEEGGATVEENLISACKKCNRTRGNMKYTDWLESDYYKKKSKNLEYDTICNNSSAYEIAENIPKVNHIKSR